MTSRGQGKTARLGLVAATALVAGNMIGSGIFLLPSALAPYGGLALGGWLVSLTGILALAWVFADFSRHLPRSGGPYAYTRHVFGDFAGFAVAWGYWVSIWCGNAAIAVALVSYGGVFVPALKGSATLSVAAAAGVIWAVTAINLLGIRPAAAVQVVTTVLKLVPLALVAAVGWFAIQTNPVTLPNVSGSAPLGAILTASALTLWAFLGVESATIPAADIRRPGTTIARATLLGVAIAGAAYILSTSAVMGIVPQAELASSAAPFAAAAGRALGGWASLLVAAGAVVACYGAINGWVLLQGKFPQVVADDGLLPGWFARVNRRGAPANALVFGSVMVTLLLVANFMRGLVALFEFSILLSTLATLLPFLLTALARLRAHGVPVPAPSAVQAVVAVAAVVFSGWAIVGTGVESIAWGVVLIGAGMPMYAVLKRWA